MATKNMKIDKMRFQTNKAGYWYVMLAIIVQIVYLIYVLNNVTNDFMIALKTIVGVVYLMTLFLCAEKIKFYSKGWSKTAFVLGFLSFARIAWIPLKSINNGDFSQEQFVRAIIYLVIQGLLLLAAGFVTYKRASALKAYIEEQGVESK